jgi:phosphoglycolate phosphatase-like HAD superfamily hydrolase
MKLALFDIDGTLLLSQGLGRAAKARAMRDIFGTEANVQTHPFGGKTDWQILNELLHPLGWTTEAIGARMTVYEQCFASYMRAMAADFPAVPLPGARELVQALNARTDVLVGVVTGNTRETAPVKLKAGGFEPSWFRVGAFGSESHDRSDLSALAVQRAEALVGAPIAPSDVFVIGDTAADVACARAVGAVSVVVLTGFEERELLLASQPDYVLNDLREFDRVPL